MQDNTNRDFIELLNDIKKLCDAISISGLDIAEDDKEILFKGLYQTKLFISDGIRIIDNRMNKN